MKTKPHISPSPPVLPTLDKALMAFRQTMTESILEEAGKSGCTLSHFEVLNFIGERENPTMKDIATYLHITPPSTSSLIDTLVSKKLVVRNQTPGDRRKVRVSLAPEARKIFSSMSQRKASVFTKMLSKLNSEDKERLVAILMKCISK